MVFVVQSLSCEQGVLPNSRSVVEPESRHARAQVDDELGRGKFSAEEWQRRQDALARNNALLFYQESKAKRLKKIKSKAYHRHLKKSGAGAESAAAALDDPAMLLVRARMHACVLSGLVSGYVTLA